jgi:CRISPR/Cas system CSM-associated protein Csm3 (group 7 of RAMP superfamily)
MAIYWSYGKAMNPYDFVRIDWNKTPVRKPASLYDRYTGLTGHITGKITALTPIFIPYKRGGSPKGFLRNGQGKAVIPGSSLKGLFRSLVETTGLGCWWLYDGQYKKDERTYDHYENNLPDAFKRCSNHEQLCVACRLFGMMSSRDHFAGKVGFDDAVCTEEKRHGSIYTPILDNPKPRHRVWYLNGDRVAGRKYYFHQPIIKTERELRTTRQNIQLNEYIIPLDKDSQFEFNVHFESVNETDEWPLLLYAILLEKEVRHKVGYAKPAGLGSVQIEIQEIVLRDPTARYRGTASSSSNSYTGEQLGRYLSPLLQKFVADHTSPTLQDLRRIWQWPPAPGVDYHYPYRTWFDEHPKASIADTMKE